MILISLAEAVERHLPFIAIALDELPDPCLLFWWERSVATFILIIELCAMQVSGEFLSNIGVVFLHHTVEKTTEPQRPYHNFPFVLPTALITFQCLGHHTSGYLQVIWGVLSCEEPQASGLHGALAIMTKHIPAGYVGKVELFFQWFHFFVWIHSFFRIWLCVIFSPQRYNILKRFPNIINNFLSATKYSICHHPKTPFIKGFFKDWWQSGR